MNFQVPQFIEVEDKIFGPFTFKQFLYLAGGAGLAFLCHVYLPIFLAIPLMLGAGALAMALAFYPVNNRPFIFALESAFNYLISSKLYLWHKEQKKEAPKVAINHKEMLGLKVPKVSDSKLHSLSWSLDIKEKVQ